jgi:hypothetical protein
MIAQQKTLGWTRKKPRAHYLGVNERPLLNSTID